MVPILLESCGKNFGGVHRSPFQWPTSTPAPQPLLAFILVLASALLFVGVTVAQMKKVHLTLRGAGVALFSLLIQPLVVLAVGHAVGIGGTIARAAALTVAFPISPVAMLLAYRYDAEEATS